MRHATYCPYLFLAVIIKAVAKFIGVYLKNITDFLADFVGEPCLHCVFLRVDKIASLLLQLLDSFPLLIILFDCYLIFITVQIRDIY